jgi:TolB-like protein
MSESSKALFLSYASQDAAAARGICLALRSAGIEVWLDQSELRGGDAWDQKIRRQVRSCALFMPLISANTRLRTEGYFRLEWKLAIDRSHLMAPEQAFLVPVAIDGTSAADTTVPERFREVQWAQLPAGVPTPEFVARIAQLLHIAATPLIEPQVSRLRDPADVDGDAGLMTRLRDHKIVRWALVPIALLIVAGLLVVRVLDRTAAPTTASASAPLATAGSAASVPAGVSLAVLPFVDMSPEHNQEYFSDGLSEEVLNQLAQIKELRVTGRTSSFSFKGKNEDLRAIGEKLGVNHLLEGSVRKSDKRLRVTAQLINAADGTDLWSHSYDSELTDIFAVQEQIAMAVAQALSVTLDVGEMSRANGGTTSVEAYDRYLRARTVSNRGPTPQNLMQAVELYREALVLDPKFARAWSALYNVLDTSLIYVPENAAAARNAMAEASAHILKLAPDAWWTQAMRTRQLTEQHRWAESEVTANAVLATAPASDLDAAFAYSVFLWSLGRANDATDLWERVRKSDPLSLDVSYDLQIALCMANRMEEFHAEYRLSKSLPGDHGPVDSFAVLCHSNVPLATLRRNYVEQHETNIGTIWVVGDGRSRADPGFKDLLRDLGIANYFRASGKWGDFCSPVGADDFECH